MNLFCHRFSFLILLIAGIGVTAAVAQIPVNDSCAGALVIRRHGDDAQTRALPEILMRHFGHGHIQGPQPVFDPAHHHALVLERLRHRQVALEREQRDRHPAAVRRPIPSARRAPR